MGIRSTSQKGFYNGLIVLRLLGIFFWNIVSGFLYKTLQNCFQLYSITVDLKAVLQHIIK